MGAGGRAVTMPRAPHEKPPFTFNQLKKAIPPHCFNRSLLRSSSYLIFDLVLVYLLYYTATTYIDTALPKPLSYLAWPVYVFAQGCVLTGVWVVGHECGHHAFSNYKWLDDTLGLILHTALLVPYFSWKISHRRHHANTNSIENDEVYIPKRKDTLQWFAKYFNNPLGRALTLFITLTLGFPMYLIFNISGKKYNKLITSHFDPFGPIFSKSERVQILITDAAYLAVTYAIIRAILAKGLSWVMWVYGGPVLVVNGFFVLITFLHHTHTSLPHFDSSEFEWMRGALATMDRDFGFLSKVFHDVTHTHVTHHLFSNIPHYHAMEATIAIKPILGKYYQIDRTPILKALWREAKECVYVERNEDDHQNKGVWWYTNKR